MTRTGRCYRELTVASASAVALLSCGFTPPDEDRHLWLLAFVLFFIVVGLPVLWIVFRVRGERQQFKSAVQALGLSSVVDAGFYVSGHPERAKPIGVRVGVDGRDFVFVDDVSGAQVFRIPRAAPTAIDIVDATKVTQTTMQNVTVGRVALLGIYALAFPKTTTSTTTDEKYVVGISWTYNGLALTTCFAFRSATNANVFAGCVAQQKHAAAS